MSYNPNNPNGQTTSGNSQPVVIALDQTVLPVVLQTATNAIGQVTANAGTNLNTSLLGLESTQSLIKSKTDNIDVLLSSRLKSSDTLAAVTTLGTITNSLPIGNNTIGNTNQTLVTAEFAKITDGFTINTVKPASTAALITDTAIVVELRPGGAAASTTDLSNGSVTAGAVATKSSLSGGQFNTTKPILTSTQQTALQLNSQGDLQVETGVEKDLFVTGFAGQNILNNNILLSTSGSTWFDTMPVNSISYQSFNTQIIASV